jgi:hypothetical protein
LNLKKRLENQIRGWLPEEPNLNGVKRTMGRRNLVKKPVLGVVLVSLGIAVLLVSFLVATRTDTVIDKSFVLKPNEKFGSYENGTYYHAHVISKAALTGEVTVQGGRVNFTAEGYKTQNLKAIGIYQNFSLVIDPAEDQYTFTFENIGVSPSTVNFTLKETWMPFLLLTPAFIILLISTPTGTILIVRGLQKEENKQKYRGIELF